MTNFFTCDIIYEIHKILEREIMNIIDDTITVSVSGTTEKIYSKLRGRAGRGGQSFSAMWAEEMQRVAEGGLTGTSLAAIATRQDAEIKQLKAEIATRVQSEGERIGCTTCANIDNCTAEQPVCRGYLKND